MSNLEKQSLLFFFSVRYFPFQIYILDRERKSSLLMINVTDIQK